MTTCEGASWDTTSHDLYRDDTHTSHTPDQFVFAASLPFSLFEVFVLTYDGFPFCAEKVKSGPIPQKPR